MWEDLCAKLENAAEDPREIRGAVADWARRPGHALAGPVCNLPEDCMYANCVPYRRFYQFLKDKGIWHTVRRAKNRVDEILKKDLDEQKAKLSTVPLKDHQMWATFDRDDPTHNPLRGLPNSVRGIRACLGLSQARKRDPLVILRYRLPSGVEPRFPTVATACAASPWGEYWAPADPGEPHGWTQPWPEHPHAHRCPEVVHEPVTGAALALKMKMVKKT